MEKLINVKKTPEKKEVHIFWSAGFDSTFLVYKALMEGHKVSTYYIDLLNNPDKTKAENNAIGLLINEFHKQFPNTMISHTKLGSIKLDYSFNMDNTYGYLLSTFLPLIQVENYSIDEIQIGFIVGDLNISYLEDIQNAYSSLMAFMKRPKVKLTFPLKKVTKGEIFGELPINYTKYVQTCEAPGYEIDISNGLRKMCMECNKCKELGRSKPYDIFKDKVVIDGDTVKLTGQVTTYMPNSAENVKHDEDLSIDGNVVEKNDVKSFKIPHCPLGDVIVNGMPVKVDDSGVFQVPGRFESLIVHQKK